MGKGKGEESGVKNHIQLIIICSNTQVCNPVARRVVEEECRFITRNQCTTVIRFFLHLIGIFLQLGTSSRAIHGGAYFSAVSGRKFNLTTVLRPCWPLACCWMFFSRPLSLLYWISLNCQVPWGWHCIFRWICLQNAKMDLSRAIFFICSTYPPIPNCFALKIRVTF